MQEFIKCLQAYLKGEKLNKIDDDKDLINLAIEQSLQTILYPTYGEPRYKKYYISWVVKQEEFLSLQNEITNIFNSNNINHLYFKGSVLCNLYDDPSIRTRGDIDVYVSPNNLEKAKKLLLDNEYEYDEVDNMHHICFKKNNIEVELHFAMIDDSHSKEIISFFSNPFELSHNIANCLYGLSDTKHFIYCLIHFAHHLRFGAGIRYILDFYYMLKKTNINYIELHNSLMSLGLLKLYNNVLNVIFYFTNEKFDKFEILEIDYFIDYMLKYGIHGNENNDVTSQSVVHKSKIRFLVSRTFLTNKLYKQAKYPILGKHWYLMPICLVKHWCYLITHKVKSLFKFLFVKNKKKDLYKKLGI